MSNNNSWFTTNDFFDPDTFDFNSHNVTTENLKAALIIRGETPDKSKFRGEKKRKILIEQLKTYLRSNRLGGSVGNSTSSSSSANTVNQTNTTHPTTNAANTSNTSQRQGLSLSHWMQKQSNGEEFKKFLHNTGSSYATTSPATTQIGTIVSDSVAILEQKDFVAGQFILASPLPNLSLSADEISSNLFYVFALTKVLESKFIRLEYLDFVTLSGKRPAVIIDEEQGTVMTIMLNRLLAIKLESSLHQMLVDAHGQPHKDAEPVLPDPKTRGLREYSDSMNGKIILTSNKSDVPSRLLRTNMIRRLSEDTVLFYIKQTGEEIDIKLDAAWSRLVSMGESMDDTVSAVVKSLPGTKHLRLIKTLPAANGDATYVELLTVGWCRDRNDRFSYSGVTLQRFTNSDLCQPSTSKVLLGEALTNFQHFLIFCFGESYDGVISNLYTSLHFGKCYELTYSTEFIRYEIERAIADVFYTVKNEFSTSVTKYDITCAVGVRSLLADRLEEVISVVSMERQNWFQSNKYTIFNTVVPAQKISPLPSPAGVQTQFCKFFFMGALGMKNNKNADYKCTTVTCRFVHAAINTITYEEAKNCLQGWSYKVVPAALAGKIQTAIETANKRKLFKP